MEDSRKAFSIEKIFLTGFTPKESFKIFDTKKSDVNPEGARYEFFMEYVDELPVECPVCKGRLYGHGTRPMTITDTTFMGAPAKLKVRIPRRKCKDCSFIWQPDIPELDENHRMTTRTYAKIANLALKHSFQDIANEYGVAKCTVRSLFVEFIREKMATLQFKTPMFLGLDEIKIKKLGEITVVTDLEHRTLYDMMLGRNQNSLTAYFEQMKNPENVLWVCTDMYRPFEKSIKYALPNARWVIDHYHVVAYANRAMDATRIHIQSKMSKDERIATKKGLAYTLRTRLRDMTAEEASKIRECRENEFLKPLAIAFDLKEDFFNIYDEHGESKENAQKAFEEWEKTIPADAIYNDFRKLANTVRNHYEQIFNYWDCYATITNAFTECSNRIIRENSIRGRGNSFEILRGRTLYRHANLERIEESGMLLGPPIPNKGPVFHFEEIKGIKEDPLIIDGDYDQRFDYDPMIGLVPGINFDPETGEIFDETLLEDWDAELK